MLFRSGRSRWVSGCVTFKLRPEAEGQFPEVATARSKKEWRRNWYIIRANSISPHLLVPSVPAERLAYSRRLSPHEAELAPAVLHLAELRGKGLTGPMIVGDFIRRGIAPLQHRHHPLWELN